MERLEARAGFSPVHLIALEFTTGMLRAEPMESASRLVSASPRADHGEERPPGDATHDHPSIPPRVAAMRASMPLMTVISTVSAKGPGRP